jgi:hypothetical protein
MEKLDVHIGNEIILNILLEIKDYLINILSIEKSCIKTSNINLTAVFFPCLTILNLIPYM